MIDILEYAQKYVPTVGDKGVDTPPSCFAKRAVLTERFGLCADGHVSD